MTIQPNSATDNAIVRFDGTTGKPVPEQDSKLIITDDGAIQSTPTGGNARGSHAIDLQLSRANAAHVASGSYAAILSGQDNESSGNGSLVCGGDGNSATDQDTAVCGGNGNTASNNSAFVGGGAANTASGINSAVLAGASNTASGDNALVTAGSGNTASDTNASVLGGINNTASGLNASVAGGNANTASGVNSTILGGSNGSMTKYGQIGWAAGQFAVAGDAQSSELIWRTITTDATANVEMFLDGGIARATVPNNTSWAFHIHMVGRDSTGVDAMWEAKGLIHNNGGVTALTAAVTPTVVADGTGGTWGLAGNFSVTADNVTSSLRLRVTGAGATNIRWVAHARLVEVGH